MAVTGMLVNFDVDEACTTQGSRSMRPSKPDPVACSYCARWQIPVPITVKPMVGSWVRIGVHPGWSRHSPVDITCNQL